MLLKRLELKIKRRMYYPIIKELSDEHLKSTVKKLGGKLNVVNKRTASKYKTLISIFKKELEYRDTYRITL